MLKSSFLLAQEKISGYLFSAFYRGELKPFRYTKKKLTDLDRIHPLEYCIMADLCKVRDGKGKMHPCGGCCTFIYTPLKGYDLQSEIIIKRPKFMATQKACPATKILLWFMRIFILKHDLFYLFNHKFVGVARTRHEAANKLLEGLRILHPDDTISISVVVDNLHLIPKISSDKSISFSIGDNRLSRFQTNKSYVQKGGES